jgi:response regulator RpfG family c-di-GMP phosphodiesterase
MKAAAIIAHQHHEWWNGKGYPRGLSGEEIHIYGRIVSIVDVFDALRSHRVYKVAMPMEEVLHEFQIARGSQFDPRLLDLFIDNLPDFVDIHERYAVPSSAAHARPATDLPRAA